MKSSFILPYSGSLFFGLVATVSATFVSAPAWSEQPLFLAYPPNNHETVADRIFLIGSAPPQGEVLINGQAISRSSAGHFAPTFPLQVGSNSFTVRYADQELKLTVTRLSTQPEVPTGVTFGKDSLTPAVNIARLANEPLCFSAIAPTKAAVSVKLAGQVIPLLPQSQNVDLPANSAVLTQQNQPIVSSANSYQGCTRIAAPGEFGKPIFQLSLNGQTTQQTGPGSVTILSPLQQEIAEVTASSGTARTGPSTDYSRLTPLPKGTQAAITGIEGEWLRLDYGAWIKRQEVQIRQSVVLPTSLIRSIKAAQAQGWTEIAFPLQVPVPVSLQQGDRTLTLTLHNTTAQTDTIKLSDDPLIQRLDWQQVQPGQVQYVFNLKTAQQWGYKLRYEGTSLILSLKHPPQLQRSPLSLSGTTIVLDPGHGGPEDLGSRGPTGYPEKDVALTVSKLLRDELQKRGATVYLTREQDIDLPLQERVDLIQKVQPTIALSLHYNALPDEGDAIKTQGIGTFWYHSQAHSLAVFLHNYLVKTLNRPSYGVFWNNLALTRPTVTPTVLLELGFMINPTEFEWIMNEQEQQQLARGIADGVVQWIHNKDK